MDFPENNSDSKSSDSSDSKLEKILILCKAPSRIERVADYLIKAGYPTKLLSSIKEAVPYILKERPTHVFVSWNINNTPKKLIKSLNHTFNIQCIPFAEWPDRDTSMAITRSGIKDIMLYPISGHGAVRLIERKQGAQNKQQEQRNLSKIQIKSSPDDIPPEGKWVAIPGKVNAWMFETDQKSKAFSKKNGRFIYHGEKVPEKQAGTNKWKVDTIKGKLDFEIINVFKSRVAVENSDTQSNLTEEQAIKRISKSLGQNIEEIDQETEENFSEEAVFSEEVIKDQLAEAGIVEKDVDSILATVTENLSQGFLAEEQTMVEKRNGRDKTTSFMREGGESEFGFVQQGNASRGGQVIIKGDKKDKGPVHIEGDVKQRGAKFFKGAKKQGGVGFVQNDQEENDSGIIFQERKQHKEHGATEEGAAGGGPSTRNFQEDNNQSETERPREPEEKYLPHLEGSKTPFAETMHRAHIAESKTNDNYPQLVTNIQKVSVITLKEKSVRGYLLVCSADDSTTENRINGLSKAVIDNLRNMKIEATDVDIMEISISEINFRDWAQDTAQFVSFVQSGDVESIMAFVPAGQEVPEIAATEASHMAAIGRETIVPEQVISFDLYLFLEKNQKFILYVKKEDKVYSQQLQNLLNRNMQHFYIRIEHSAEYKKYCVRHFIKSKIESAKKYIKAS